jgi:hypothetical protein
VLPALTGVAMLRKLAVAAVVLAAGWFVFFIVSNVDTRDVVAYNDIEDHVGSQPFRAGDLVAVTGGGPAPRYICSPEIAPGEVRDTRLDKAYVNGLGQALSPFIQLVGAAAGMVGAGKPDAEVAAEQVAVRFTGRISTFPGVGSTPSMSPECACDVAVALLRRNQVCMVERSLIETRVAGTDAEGRQLHDERTVGITLRPDNVIFSAEAIFALDCPDLRDANLGLALQTGSCADGPGPGYDAALRHILGVIREEAPDDSRAGGQL